MKLLIELQIIVTFTSMMWFNVLGMHRVLLRMMGKQPWEQFKPFSCWLCTQHHIGVMAIAAYQLAKGFDLQQLIMYLCLNYIIAKLMDSKFGFEIGLKEENKRLQAENEKLKIK